MKLNVNAHNKTVINIFGKDNHRTYRYVEKFRKLLSLPVKICRATIRQTEWVLHDPETNQAFFINYYPIEMISTRGRMIRGDEAHIEEDSITPGFFEVIADRHEKIRFWS